MTMGDAGYTFGDWMQQYGNPVEARTFFGLIPAYPVFMGLGILMVIIIVLIHLKSKGIPLREFEIGLLVVVPIGILGASIFGKVFIPYYQDAHTWYEVFFFWKPGMSLFGSLMAGTFAGWVLFYIRSKKTQISVWVYADCIIPHILIGQMIGRWGNFFNHEIMGAEVTWDQLTYLPDWIRSQLFYFPPTEYFWTKVEIYDEITNEVIDWKVMNLDDYWRIYRHSREIDYNAFWYAGPVGLTYGGIELQVATDVGVGGTRFDEIMGLTFGQGQIPMQQPLFLFESIANFCLWIVITFIIRNLGRFFSKPKPWDLQPKGYPGWFNKQYKSLPISEVASGRTIAPVKYKKIKVKDENGNEVILKMGLYHAWNKAYYWYDPEKEETDELLQLNIERWKRIDDADKRLEQNKMNYKKKYNNMTFWRLLTSKHTRMKHRVFKKEYQDQKKKLYAQYGTWSRWLNVNPHSEKLNKINNPNNYFVIRSGVATSCFLTGYVIIRICLETLRRPEELMIPNFIVANFIVLGLFLVLGIALIVFTQFIAPKIWREIDWLYEKSY